MACLLPAPSRMAVSRSRPSPVPSPAPTVVEIHIADEWAPSCRDPSPFPSLDPDHGPSRGLAVGRPVDVYGMRGPVHLASYLTPAKEDVCS